MRQLWLIRHAESASNAGLATESPQSNPLTDKGREHAERCARNWGAPPDLIIRSPFVRAYDTAEPLIKKFPTVPNEVWPVHEWTQLAPEKYRGTTQAQRHPKLKTYWDRNDPFFCDGPGAEPFNELFTRVHGMFLSLEDRFLRMPAQGQKSFVAVFTHGHFMRATLWHLLDQGGGKAADSMRRFRAFTDAVGIPNLTALPLVGDHNGHWYVGEPEHL